MCELLSSGLLFHTYIPTLIISLAFAFAILFSDLRNPVNRNLFWIILFCCYWNVVSFLGYSVENIQINLLLSRLEALFSLVVLFLLYFSIYFSGKELTLRKKIILLLPFLPLIIFAFTNYNSHIIDSKTCQTQGGTFYYGYLYFLTAIYTFFAIKNLVVILRDKKSTDAMRQQVRIIIIAFFLAALWFLGLSVVTNFALARDYHWADEIFLYAPIGVAFFVGLLAFAFIRYKSINVRALAMKVMGVALLGISAMQAAYMQELINRALGVISFLLSFIFVIFLMRSIERENRKKIELEKANEEINKRKNQLQRMSVALDRSNSQLRELDNAKSEFISIASHQLRTPLSVIKGYVSMLLEGSYGELDKVKQEVLDKIFTNNERLVVLVEDLLDISRIESGRMEFKLSNFNLIKLCQEVFEMFQMKAAKNNLKFKLEKIDTDLPEVMIDGAKIHEVLCNLVDNAIKYCPQGEVIIRIEKGKRDLKRENFEKYKISNIKARESDDVIRIIIVDTGIGIEEFSLPYLFAKFSRGKDTNRLTSTGTGLGLYVGREIVEANGGKIWAESEGKDKGSRFIVEIPVKQDPEIIKKWS